MTYRDDLIALSARKDALEQEVSQKSRELADATQLLDEARARMRLPVLDGIRVAAPCSADWDAMTGDDRVRHCDECKLDVYNLSGMTRDEAEDLVASRIGPLCVRFYRRTDGTLLTADCPTGVRRRHRRRLLIASATGAVAGGALAVWTTALPVATMGDVAVPTPRAIAVTPAQVTAPPVPGNLVRRPEEMIMGGIAAPIREPVRITGTEQVVPDGATRAAIAKKHVAKVVGTWKLCIDEQGAVTDAKMLKSTGFPRYDRAIGKAVRAWTYSDGGPTCTAVTFVYSP